KGRDSVESIAARCKLGRPTWLGHEPWQVRAHETAAARAFLSAKHSQTLRRPAVQDDTRRRGVQPPVLPGISSPKVLCPSGSAVGWLTVAGARARRRAGQCLQRGHHRHRPAANSAAGGAPIAAASWKSSRWSSLAGYHVGGLAPDVHRTPLKASFLL